MEKIIFFSIPEEELLRKIVDALFATISGPDFIRTPIASTDWLTHAEAASYIKKTVHALYQLSSKRKLRYSKRGKQNYYLKKDLDEYLLDGIVDTEKDIRASVQLKTK